ncbi:unnamed protein product (mitochondrion) [Plasmodiophora brassicae]|uniref:RNA helicase n=1 Tax=Plasmodiophora brassicae TaxID=37360 RepID=A0A3P3XYM8_PLABS|nr:unnamed protein product [Plasmodiophora brassicae]
MARSPESSYRSSSSHYHRKHRSSGGSSSSRRHRDRSSSPTSKKRERDASDNGFSHRKSKKKSASIVNVFAQGDSTQGKTGADDASAAAAAISERLERLNAWKMQTVAQPEEPQPTMEERSKDESLAIDPLDAFMQTLTDDTAAQPAAPKEEERYFGAQEVFSEEDFDQEGDEGMTWMQQREKKFRKKEIKRVDHSKMAYISFRKNFYVEPKEIREMTEEEVAAFRRDELEGVAVRGKNCPRPIRRWTQCGLSDTTLQLLQKFGYSAPFPIQAQAIPVIMSGRDCIACAKTGSGKTLAFVLPMIRHILDQPPLKDQDGPVALILAPTRELAIQIHNEVRKFCKPVNLRSVCCYGGAAVSEQIAALKRGAEIIVATPGRFIDMLSCNQGRVTNLRRVTYVVLDEADRIQTVMFSATFPKQIEGLAKKTLKNPVEIIIGGRSVASNTVVQAVEVMEMNQKHRRLLQLLGEWYEKGSILIFVDRQESVDQMYRDLTASGYLCLALHGGMDQCDRDYTILDFKKQVRTVMVATSVAARGLDIKELILVINYNVPNHYEDYVHRVGRTGRAGTTGWAFTFITPEEERYAPDMVKALEAANLPVSDELRNLAQTFKAKVDAGEVKFASNSGYSTKGFKFDEEEAQLKMKEQARQKRSFGLAEDLEVEDEEKEADDKRKAAENAERKELEEELAAASATTPAAASIASQIAGIKAAIEAAKQTTDAEAKMKLIAAAKANAAALALKIAMESGTAGHGASDGTATGVDEDYHCEELDINDYPQNARWKVTARAGLNEIHEKWNVSVTTRGTYVPVGRTPGIGERKLYLMIEGHSKMDVILAKKEIRRLLEEAAIQSKPEDREQYSKYTVV